MADMDHGTGRCFPRRLPRVCAGACVVFVVLSACDGAPPVPPVPTSTTVPGEIRLSGVVETGTEPGCLLLRAGSATYLLLGGDPAVLVPGRRVVVHGAPRPGLVTTCQQGTPFQVRVASSRAG